MLYYTWNCHEKHIRRIKNTQKLVRLGLQVTCDYQTVIKVLNKRWETVYSSWPSSVAIRGPYKNKYKYNSYFYCAFYSLTDDAL